ncbi:MAG: primosomal protein N' [Chloroflexi bacterium]|nr:primosomal protein N' [Chloroflexota bacterium]
MSEDRDSARPEAVRYAEVAVLGSPIRGSQLFSYQARAQFARQIAPGQLVLVEFGRRELLGVVFGVSEEPPPLRTKPVLAILELAPLVPQLQRHLAAWTADRFATPIGSVLEAMLPPRIGKYVSHRFASAPAAEADGLSRHRRSIVAALEELRVGTRAEITAQVGRPVSANALNELVGLGRLRRWSQLELPETGTPVAELTIPPAEALARIQDLARAPAQRRLLLRLIAAGEPVAVRDLLAAGGSRASLKNLARTGWVDLRRRFALPELGKYPGEDMEDLAAQNALEGFLERPGYGSLLLQGRLAERLPAYLRVINRMLAADRQVLLLAPSQAEAAALGRALIPELSGRTVVLSDATTPGQRVGLWRALRAGEVDVLIGHPPAVWAPLTNLGLVIVDREEDRLYKAAPLRTVSAAQAARELARIADIPMVLGTATPLVSTFNEVEHETIRFVLLRSARLLRQLRMKVGRGWGNAAGSGVAQIIDMRSATLMGPGGMISEDLCEALETAFSAGQRSVVHVATRGSATATACRECGFRCTCRYCSASLFWHEDRDALVCHICGDSSPPPEACPECGSPALRTYGYGTQSVVRALRSLMPRARIDRIDSDLSPQACQRNAQRFSRGVVNILVGTTRLLAFAEYLRADLLGVVQADFGLNFPDYQAPERVYQTLSRLRDVTLADNIEGTMLLQARDSESYVLEAVRTGSYLKFFRTEIELRRRYRMPPFRELTRFVIGNRQPQRAESEALALSEQIESKLVDSDGGDDPPQIWGPAQCQVWRQRGIFRWHMIVLSGPGQLRPVFGIPHGGWVVDVDPVDFY